MQKPSEADERAYQLAKAYIEILRERGVKKWWNMVSPTAADIAEATKRADLKKFQEFK